MNCPSCQAHIEGTPRFCPTCGTALPAASGAAAGDPLIGQTLGGKYRVVRLLGEGGMGAVYEGEQPLGSVKRKVAIKTLHPHLSRDPKIQARFEREVATIAELEHPNTIQVYDFGSTPEGILYIVMEFLHGRSVADRLAAEGAMPPERVAHIVDQIAGSLEEAHARGIVHRDLKPDNVVLVERAGQKDFVKVLDFGIAKRAAEPDAGERRLTEQGMVLGTPPYMSPEQFSGRPIDWRSDVYSLGVMAYEMLTGKLPFHANTAWEWAAQHMTQPPIPIEALAEGGRVPVAMRNAVAKALAKSADERFQSVRAFSDAFAGRIPTAPADAPPAVRPPAGSKTEMAAPIDVASPRPPVIGHPSQTVPAPPAPYPTGGNFAVTPAVAIPDAPPPVSRRSSRGWLVALLAVVGVASVAAVAFALHGSHSAASPGAGLPSNADVAPITSLTPASVGSDEVAGPLLDGGNDIPPLTFGGKPAARGPGHPSSAAGRSGPGGSTAGSAASAEALPPALASALNAYEAQANAPQRPLEPAPSSAGTPSPPNVAPAGGRYDGPECQKARVLRNFGRNREARSWALACIAKGGSP